MNCASATGSEGRAGRPLRGHAARGLPGTLLPAASLLAVLLLAALGAGCSSQGSKSGTSGDLKDQKTVLLTRKGENSIRVTEAEEDGNQVVRVNTVFRGEENTIVLNIDQPVYEVEIPLSLDQVIPQAASAAVRGPEGQFQDLLIAQYLQKAQEAMLAGDYNGALKQVDTVLQIRPNHVQAHSMKGSVYYALGNYELANQEWEYVLAQDPSNKEVLDFKAFLSNRTSGRPPKLPGAPEGTQAPQAPAARGASGGAAPSGAGAPAPTPGGTKR
jgi:Tetratricopeptide repeat